MQTIKLGGYYINFKGDLIMGDGVNIITLQMTLTEVTKKCYNDIEGVLKKFGEFGSIPSLPSFETIMRQPKEYYNTCNSFIVIGDEVSSAIVSLDVVYSSILDIKNTKLPRGVSNDYSLVQNFKKSLDSDLERLERYRFSLIELRRQVTDRIKLLQAINFM
jgi:hypothetical protein